MTTAVVVVVHAERVMVRVITKSGGGPAVTVTVTVAGGAEVGSSSLNPYLTGSVTTGSTKARIEAAKKVCIVYFFQVKTKLLE